MELYVGLIFGALALLAVIFICLWRSFSKFQDQKRSQAQETTDNLDAKISSTYQAVFGEVETDCVKCLNNLHGFVLMTLQKIEKQYFSENGIRQAVDTHSAFGRCGVSDSYLYTNVGRATTYDILVEKGSLSKLYIKVRNASKELVDGKPNYDHTISHIWAKEIEDLLPLYMDLKKNSCDYSAGKIALDDIKYFSTSGSKQYIATTVVGAYGGATSVRDVDRRSVFLVLKKQGQWVNENIVSTNVEATLNALRQLMPQKEENIVQMEEKTVSTDTPSVADDLKQYKELLDSGVITQEEFDAMKKKRLGL